MGHILKAANKSAAGKGGITILFHTERACPALPERYRSAALTLFPFSNYQCLHWLFIAPTPG
jgi:hypothetical protein